MALKFRSDTFTMLGHHWNQAATNWRKAQVKGLGLATRNQVDLTHDGKGGKVPENYFDPDGRFTKEFGYASPYTHHGGTTTTENHYHYPPPSQTQTPASGLPASLLPLLLGSGLALAAWWFWPEARPDPLVPGVDVEAETTYIPPQ
jgi:hypothetical protein